MEQRTQITPAYVKLKAAAAYVGVSERTLLKNVPSSRKGRCILFSFKNLDARKAEMAGKTEDPPVEIEPRPNTGTIYFALDEVAGKVKIGFTSGDPLARIKALQIGSANKIRLVGARQGEQKIETELHRRFDSLRDHGEWFEWGREIQDFLAAENAA